MQDALATVGATDRRPAATLLSIRDLHHRYGEREVLRGLSFDVGVAQIVGLLGPNGCGKSTTFQILTGLVRPTSGEIRLEGNVVTPGDRRIRSRIGVVFQSSSLDARLSASENLALSARLYGVEKNVARARADELLQFMDLHARSNEPVIKWSGGMRRRLELARSLLHSPDMLLLDEPTSGLDELSFQRTWERILSLRDSRKLAVLLTTHRPEEAERCDKVAIVDAGVVVAEGTPAELKARVSGDVLSLEAEDLASLVVELRDNLNIDAKIQDDRAVIEHEKGHALIPRIVEALPAGRLRSVSMRRPSLADVFVKLTGRTLGTDAEPESKGK